MKKLCETYLSIRQAAEMLHLNRSQVWRHIDNNNLKAERIDQRWFIRKSDVDKFTPRHVGRPAS